MSLVTIILLSVLLALLILTIRPQVQQKHAPITRLIGILDSETLALRETVTPPPERADSVELASVSDELGKAGFFTEEQRRNARMTMISLIIGSSLCFGIGTFVLMGALPAAIGGFVGAYFGFAIWLIYLRRKRNDLRRDISHYTPIALEMLILLVESGLGIFPALGKLVSSEDADDLDNPVHRLLRLSYDLSLNGMAFSKALSTIAQKVNHKTLKHVLLHLDISGSEGGELIPSLRSLVSHSHTEWKLSVETRVREIENLTVIPVFVCLAGMMCLILAVPLVPFLEFRKNHLQAAPASLEPTTGSNHVSGAGG